PGAVVAAGLWRGESAYLKSLEQIRHRRSVLDSGKPAVLAAQTDARVKHDGDKKACLSLGEAEGFDRRHPAGKRHRSTSPARPGSNRVPRPVRPPARPPLARNRVKPARTLPATWAPR